ncbi:hypothetical protein Cadr_000025996 [Camelus dromedarius]|uniref:Uncharacterized protein n=1 Tax=Camelus dromedarius TaxID=9838 RepID=A0A5N4CE76_CAMDR|nr:hypothetical protein Cadr_000025996 [Camelus dromedarius]
MGKAFPCITGEQLLVWSI